MISPEAFLITLRESLEAFLIVGILAGLVVKLGHPEARRPLYYGVGAALGLSVLVGVAVIATVQSLSDTFQEAFEGVAALIAVGILTYMVFWMYKHTIQLVASLRDRTRSALDAGKPFVLFSLAFVAVAREGLETVLFFGALAPSTGVASLVVSALAALALGALLAYLVFAGVVQLSIQRFFAVTGVLLILFAGGLLMTAAHEFAEVGWLPETPHVWDTSGVLDQDSTIGAFAKAVFGYRDSPMLLEAAAYALYVIGLGAWYLRGVVASGGSRDPVAGGV